MIHLPSGQSLGYGALIEAARSIDRPENVPLKDPQEFKLIGQSTPRLDAAALILGQVVYGIDVSPPGMVCATVARCPTLGGQLHSFDASAALRIDGVVQVAKIPTGVAVLANSTYAALEGRAALEVAWEPGPNAGLSSASIRRQFLAAAQRKGAVQRTDGNASRVLGQGLPIMEAVYTTPYLAHGCMEPMNCTVWIREDRLQTFGSGLRLRQRLKKQPPRLQGCPSSASMSIPNFWVADSVAEAIPISFGEAVHIARVSDKPIQLMWTRQDDFQYDQFRPANLSLVKAALDQNHRPRGLVPARGRSPLGAGRSQGSVCDT